MIPKTPEQSVASQRLEWLVNHQVEIRLKSKFDGSHADQLPFNAIYLDTIPVGRAYFFLIVVENHKTLIETTDVSQITDLS